MTEITASDVDPVTANAAKVFLQRIAHQFAFEQAILFGSRARHTHRPDGDDADRADRSTRSRRGLRRAGRPVRGEQFHG